VNREPEQSAKPAVETAGLLALAVLAVAGGAATGLIGATFRLTLDRANEFRDAVLEWAHGREFVGLALVVGAAAAATALAAWLVHRFSPQASGSGIPHVEAVLHGDLPAAQPPLIPVKFVGGALAIGAGLALGREGPSVQMGASVSHLIGAAFRRTGARGRACRWGQACRT
jgi:CIC family chloride channel protein